MSILEIVIYSLLGIGLVIFIIVNVLDFKKKKNGKKKTSEEQDDEE